MNTDTEHLELNKKKWDASSKTYDEKRFNYFRFFQKRVITLANIRPGQRFLDIGCGTGWAVRYAAGLVGESGEACGIDLSPMMIERAVANATGMKNIRFIQANAEDLPFLDDYFDAVICTNSFHHYLHPAKVLEGVRRVLKTGGRIHILDVTSDDFIGRMIDRRAGKREAEHVKFYTSKEFRGFFNAAGLQYSGSRTVLPPLKVHVAVKPA